MTLRSGDPAEHEAALIRDLLGSLCVQLKGTREERDEARLIASSHMSRIRELETENTALRARIAELESR